ncbi:MAG: hypothetical protein IFNCLDLE_02688 [Ignavibacteriaceae bacterium]|nr:hypothetical protein [Ignavibacteriaceae bacterium]
MRIINYPQYTNLFDCVISGRILISLEENAKIYQLIMKMKAGRDYETYYPWIPKTALDDIELGMQRHAEGKTKNLIYNIRVTATNYIVNNMPHTGKLKRANYYFEVVTQHGSRVCPVYNEPVLPNEDGNCSLCEAHIGGK